MITNATRDPSRTLTLRRAYTADYNRRWKQVKAAGREFLQSGNLTAFTPEQQAAQYRAFLQTQIDQFVDPEGQWQNRYIRAAYTRGLNSAHMDLRRSGVPVDDADVVGQFAHAQALAMLQAQARQDLRKINTVAMQQLQDKVALALASGMPLPEVQKVANDRINKIGMTRSRQLVGTLIVGTVADAFLNRVVDFGVALVSPIVEMQYTTAGDDRVCPVCEASATQDNGNGPGVYTIQEARGLIPQHVGCRCGWRISVAGLPGVRIPRRAR